jgi:hypothetical protein
MEFEKTAIEVGDLIIQEPVTALTDLFVSIVCLYAFNNLRGHSKSLTFLKFYFLTMAIATAYGGIIGHAFLDYLSFGWKVPGWLVSMVSVGLIERAAIYHAQPLLSKRTGNLFIVLNTVELVSLITIVLITVNFLFVEAHAAYGLLLVVFLFEVFIFSKTKAQSSRIMMLAVGVSAIAALVHLTGFTIHKWFNHLDLSHVLMAVAAYVFYIAAKNLQHETRMAGKGPVQRL